MLNVVRSPVPLKGNLAENISYNKKELKENSDESVMQNQLYRSLSRYWMNR